MAVQCGTVTVLYFVTPYDGAVDNWPVMAVQCGTVTVLYCVTLCVGAVENWTC